MLKPHGIRLLHKCTSVRHAVFAEKRGVDAISIESFECAGHPGEDDIPGLILIPSAADKVKQAYVDNDERGTNLIFRSLKNTARVGKSAVSDEAVRRLAQPGAGFADVKDLVAGDKGRNLHGGVAAIINRCRPG